MGRTAKPPRTAGASRPPSPFRARTRPEAEAIPMADQRLAGYLVMPQGRRNSAFAQAFQQSIGAVAARQPCGWVVDLRGNGGGDMWPMLAGLGPLLGDGAVGGSVDAAGRRDHWVYERGEAIFVDAAGVRKPIAVVAEPVTVTAESIAVLIDRGTAGSGEAIALAFRGDTRARLFGETTYGASTATRGFKLSDGANLVIAVSTFIDRSGRPYPHGVQPDVKIAGPDTLPSRSDDAVLQSALAWLRDQPSCADRAVHSARSTTAGSTDVARRSGTSVAAQDAAAIATAAAAKLTASVVAVSKTRLWR
jgi:C-terminal processing protease CtpA/Prc